MTSKVEKGMKRKQEEEDQTLPRKMKGIPEVDKEVSTMKGAKVDAFFHPKTKGQEVDQQVFFKDTLPRLETHLKTVLEKKKAGKWNLVYHCTLSMPDRYPDHPLIVSPPYPSRTDQYVLSTAERPVEWQHGELRRPILHVFPIWLEVDPRREPRPNPGNGGV